MAFEDIISALVSEYGLLGVFIASIIANATIFLPLPMAIVVFAIASLSHSLGFVIALGFVAGLGSAIGEMTGYLLGFLGVSTAEKFTKKKIKGIEDIQLKLENRGMLFIFITAATPFPFDVIGIIAGLIRYDVAKFFVALSLGRLLRYELIALAGFFGIEIIKKAFGLG